MSDSVFMSEITWPQFEEKVKAGAPVFLPIGSTEQHGPHLPLGVDIYLPTGVCERVAKEVGGLVAPTISYGYKSQPRSGGGEVYPGTLGLDAHTLSLVIRDVVHGLGRHGVKRLVLVNGHFENCWPAVEGLDLGLRELRRDGFTGITAMRLEYWDFVKRETLDKLFPDGFPGTELEHASLLETSLMLLLRPDLVDMAKVPSDGPAKFPNYDVTPFPPGLVPPSGVLADARGSTAKKGQWLMDDHVPQIAAAVRKEFGL
ncbi:Creatinine amidohydrolase [Hartmannibacter diazotrophicus]|uniref:Creatinine amidohydrolase n=1 Tax=Hartmannibacter diazotrophicus TaxID=1482074 RepID=A0A2C9D924_9HYPH|nr:creatininase [Hartmannibacter diazotrophicus]SON56834.1 Creatinine amidohydrolase [Hartmannibacter diazotrophicus]